MTNATITAAKNSAYRTILQNVVCDRYAGRWDAMIDVEMARDAGRLDQAQVEDLVRRIMG